jgi:hypothetical protein
MLRNVDGGLGMKFRRDHRGRQPNRQKLVREPRLATNKIAHGHADALLMPVRSHTADPAVPTHTLTNEINELHRYTKLLAYLACLFRRKFFT